MFNSNNLGTYDYRTGRLMFPSLPTYLKSVLDCATYKTVENKVSKFKYLGNDNYDHLNRMIGTIHDEVVFNAIQNWKYSISGELQSAPKGTPVMFH